MTPHYIYVIKSEKDGRLYKGLSEEPDRRLLLLSHNSGKVNSTKGYRPRKIIYTECYPSFEEARARELFLKSGKGRDFLKSLNL
ncbi:MAG TPA: GIY-YIG nuclease family protein [Cyclobacteriaceae bacterium]|nr:GIY-YIG nuclease family protein [Cyclobacteriaceae bacterium]